MSTAELRKVIGVELDDGHVRDPSTWDQLERKPDKRDEKGGLISEGAPYVKSTNVDTILRHDPRCSGVIRYNEFSGQVFVRDKPLTDNIVTKLILWMSRTYQLEMANPKRFGALINAVAGDHKFHPIREYLAALKWDTVPRTAGMLAHYFGATSTELVREVSRRWMISCVARAYKPGCKVDTMLVLKGAQGKKKSTGLEALAGEDEWFSNSSVNFGSKDGYLALHGVWIFELAELASIRRSELETFKAFTAARFDKFRRPFGTCDERFYRQTVFCGTTNRDEFLNDPTGDRRFWPVCTKEVDLDGIRRDRDQLWAEAVADYMAGEQWWLSDDGARELQVHNADFRMGDSWEEVVGEWLLTRRSEFTVRDVLVDAIKKDVEKHSTLDEMRIARILRGLGVERLGRRRRNGTRCVVWKKLGEVVQIPTAGGE